MSLGIKKFREIEFLCCLDFGKWKIPFLNASPNNLSIVHMSVSCHLVIKDKSEKLYKYRTYLLTPPETRTEQIDNQKLRQKKKKEIQKYCPKALYLRVVEDLRGKKEKMRSKRVIVFCLVVASLAAESMGTMEDEEQECVDQLANLASCIPFVSGTAKKPTPECCENTRKVKSTKPKCLCVLIKESSDPSMGLPVNTTLAIQMPSACNINDAKVSDCPCNVYIPPTNALLSPLPNIHKYIHIHECYSGRRCSSLIRA